ncbi:MAG: hypothetical protein ACM3MG_03215 [Bacillota bacterium]
MKKLIALGMILTAALAIAGCGKGSSSSNNAGVTCPVGSNWNGQYCVTSNGNIVSPGTTNIRYYDYIYYFQIDYFTKMPTVNWPNSRKSMTITNPTVYKKFLKEAMAVCDRNIWGYSSGYASCDNWTGGSMILQIDLDSSLKPSVYFTAIPSYSMFTFNIGIDGGGMAYNPLALIQNTTYNLINQSQGFEIRTNGSYTNGGGLHLIQIQVVNGKPGDDSFTYQVYYPDANGNPQAFLTGILSRY